MTADSMTLLRRFLRPAGGEPGRETAAKAPRKTFTVIPDGRTTGRWKFLNDDANHSYDDADVMILVRVVLARGDEVIFQPPA